MQKRIAIVLILLLFLSHLGYYFYYAAQRAEVRDEMEQRLVASIQANVFELVIQENDNNINWQEPRKEFFLGGKLYDVAGIKKINGETFLYCINDKKEHGLLEDLAKFVKSGTDAGTDAMGGKHTIKFQLNDYILDHTERIAYSVFIVTKEYNNFDVAIYPSSICEINVPPPQA